MDHKHQRYVRTDKILKNLSCVLISASLVVTFITMFSHSVNFDLGTPVYELAAFLFVGGAVTSLLGFANTWIADRAGYLDLTSQQ